MIHHTAGMVAECILLRGRVQGYGVRPAIVRAATILGIRGYVVNRPEGVCVHAEADSAEAVFEFRKRLRRVLPSQCGEFEIESERVDPVAAEEFRILPSADAGQMATVVPPDLGICGACRNDMLAQKSRRFGYPLITCTDCGPRFSIITKMPYERARTSMSSFDMCPACAAEYVEAEDRRFHSQTNACPVCGPHLYVGALRRQDPASDVSHTEVLKRSLQEASDEWCLALAAETICGGGIVALKGVGGYQLICDATSDDAVSSLRAFKNRAGRPFAVMLLSEWMDTDSFDNLDAEIELLRSCENPIVLVPAKVVPSVSKQVAPGLCRLGVFLPTTALHDGLLRRCQRPLVVTSGNVSGVPLVYKDETAVTQFAGHVDLVLCHNREIVRPVDDSVVQVAVGRGVTIRAGRGLAPIPLNLRATVPMLAVGGHQKVAIALADGHKACLGPHIGNMDSVESRERFKEVVSDLQQLYCICPRVIVHDAHPDYFTSRWAEQQPVPTVSVQHHHAHVAASMLEYGLLQQRVVGVAFDGTGWGPDGTIWGGEFLLADVRSFRRVATLRPFALPGGDAAVREPWRVATALLKDAGFFDRQQPSQRPSSALPEVALVCRLLSEFPALPVAAAIDADACPVTSSMGRLFDAVAFLALGTHSVSFEGEAAMKLQAVCDTDLADDASYCFDLETLSDGRPALICWRPVIRQVVRDIVRGVSAGIIAMKFHRAVAGVISRIAMQFRQYDVVLTGGCFQNQDLTELAVARLADHPRRVFSPGRIPPGDGGLAAGQLVVAQARQGQAEDGEDW